MCSWLPRCVVAEFHNVHSCTWRMRIRLSSQAHPLHLRLGACQTPSNFSGSHERGMVTHKPRTDPRGVQSLASACFNHPNVLLQCLRQPHMPRARTGAALPHHPLCARNLIAVASPTSQAAQLFTTQKACHWVDLMKLFQLRLNIRAPPIVPRG